MIDSLEDMLPAFDGERARVRCFAHIINLVAKSVLQLFEQPKGRKGSNAGGSAAVAAEVDDGGDEINEFGVEDDDVDGWRDERERMSEGENKELDASIQPIGKVLTKVSRVYKRQ